MNIFICWVLPALWILFILVLLRRNKFFTDNGFSSSFITFLFIAKCAAGIIHNYISLYYLPHGGDVASIFGDGLELYKTFMHSPSSGLVQIKQMFSLNDVDILNSNSSFIHSVFDSIKFIYFILDFFSFGNLYTDTILFNGFAVFAFLHGGVFFKRHFNSNMPFIFIFLMPSAFFYTSAIFKEGLVFILICFMLPLGYKLYKSFRLLDGILFALLFIFIFFLKFLIAITFLGSVILWWILLSFPHNKKLVVATFIAITVTCFFSINTIIPKLNMPQAIINRQEEFLKLNAHSKINVPYLEPTFGSFLASLPRALNNVLFKPLPGEGGRIYYIAFTLEIVLFWGFMLFLWIRNKWRANFNTTNTLAWSLFLFGIANLIIIGYTIPNIGAITRYRSIFFPFIGLFFWSSFNRERLLS